MNVNDLERLVAIEDLRHLQARYVRYADAGDWRSLAGLFLPEAQFVPHGMDGKPQVTMRGRGEIERRVSASVGKGSALHHLFSYAGHLYGIHLSQTIPLRVFQSERPWDLTEGRLVPEHASDALRAQILLYQRTYASHVAVHMLDAQTITHGLNDSPVGMLAWLLQRWKKWSDKRGDFDAAFPRDHILTNATIFWANQAIGSSIRSYANANRHPWRPSHDRTPMVEAPAGFTFLTGDASPPGVDVSNRVDAFRNGPMGAAYNTVYARAHEKGGHFVPWENPGAVIEDIRATFRPLRS